MSSKERVLTAFARQTPDRVPINYYANAAIDARLKEHFGLGPKDDERLKQAFDRQKSYADLKRRDIQYEVGDKVFLKVSPWKKVFRFGKKGKLSPRFIGLFDVIERIGLVAY